uniref:RNA-directed DNA polymerase, eukaryota, reverse transcriptase zinc-binding domain protein n=1 Tax=Tanacetum cinerariifolium TaxID=118510 RepID=A0A699JY21_TANCI|nr:hypothetical protein [Tanacetum cinerariifolium]
MKNGNLYEKVENCIKNLKVAQTTLDNNPHNHELKRKEAITLEEYNKATTDEENFLFQKAKVDWISKESRNNQYFHKVLKSKRQANKIVSICDDQGNRLEGKLMEEQFVNHFHKFLKASKDVNDQRDFEGVFDTKLNNDEAKVMAREVTDTEIKKAMFNFEDNKAPGPDGYTFTFFEKA